MPQNYRHLCQVTPQFSTNQDCGIKDFLRDISLCGTFILFSLIYLTVWGTQLTNQLRRFWELKRYLTPIEDGSFTQNGFSLVPSSTKSQSTRKNRLAVKRSMFKIQTIKVFTELLTVYLTGSLFPFRTRVQFHKSGEQNHRLCFLPGFSLG